MRLIFYTDTHGENPVKEFIESLSTQANNKVSRVLVSLHEFGIGTHIREAKKIIGTPIWEVRILGKDSIRIMYTVITNDGVLLLHGFIKKSQKTPSREIHIAIARLRDWRRRYS